MGSPDTSTVPVRSEAITDPETTWSVEREQFLNRATVKSASKQVLALPHADRMEYSQEIEASVTADDPGSAAINRKSSVDVEYPTETVRIRTENMVSSALSQARTRIFIDDRKLFDETWKRIPDGGQ